MTDAEIFNSIAMILDAGARKARQWTYNNQMQNDAEVLDAMALAAKAIAESVTE